MELIKKTLSPARLPLVVGLLLLVALPTTLFLIKKNQDTRQNASGNTSDISGAMKKSVLLNGSSYLTYDNSTDIKPPFQVEAWINPRASSSANSYAVFASNDTTTATCSSNFSLITKYENGKYRLGLNLTTANVTNTIYSSELYTYDAWTHVAVSVSTNNFARLYANGKVAASMASAPFCGHPSKIFIGNAVSSPQRDMHFNGLIAEVRIVKENLYGDIYKVPIVPFIAGSETVGLWHFTDSLDDSGPYHLALNPSGSVQYVSNTPTSKVTQWNTKTVNFLASNFYVEVDGKRYYGDNASLKLNSDPGNSQYTTLEAQWKENDVEMRFFVYFASDGKTWKVTEMRTYDGTANNKWIYYTGTGIANALGQPFVSATLDKASVKSESSKIGYIHFGTLSVQPFISTLPSISIIPTGACTPVDIKSVSFGKSCGGTNDLVNGVTFTCTDGYSSSIKSCTSYAKLKQTVVQTCSERVVCPSNTPTKPPLQATPTPPGTRCDVNGDGKANVTDFTMFYYCMQASSICTPTMKARADLVRNGKVDSSDLFQYSRACLNEVSPTPLPPQPTYVPKPSVYPSLIPRKVTTPPSYAPTLSP